MRERSAETVFADALSWHWRLNRYVVADIPHLPGATVVAHLHGLYPDYPKLYVMLRTRKKTFVCFVLAFPDLGVGGSEEALKHRAEDLERLDVPALIAFLAEREPVLRTGHLSQISSFMARFRRDGLCFDHPDLGAVGLYPLQLPTLLRGFGFDPGHPAYGVRRDWLAVSAYIKASGTPVTGDHFARFMATETERAAKALAAAAPLVDTAATEAMELITRYRQDSYRYYHGDGEKARIRRQAARAYPVFARAIPEVPTLRRAVDGKRPLVPALARHYLVSEKTVKGFQSFHHVTFPDHVDYLLFFLEDIDGSLTPAKRYQPGQALDHDQWACFATLAHEINGMAAYIGKLPGRRQALNDLLAGFDGDWAALFRDLGGHVFQPDPPAVGLPAVPGTGSCLDPMRWAQEEERIAGAVAWDNFRKRMTLSMNSDAVRDAVRAFAYAIVLPQAAHATGADAVPLSPPILKAAELLAIDFLLKGRTVRAAVDLARKFHSAVGALFPADGMSRLKGANLAWDKPSAAMTAPNGLDLVPLGSVQDLAQEGVALKNCLPFYTVRCAVEGARVVSIRAGEVPIGAVELVRDGVGAPWRPRQVEGAANTPPAPGVELAAQWYLDHLNAADNDLTVPPDAKAGDSDVLRSLCGYDWRDPVALDAMWRLWAKGEGRDGESLLPKGASRKGLDGLKAHASFLSLVADLTK